MLCCILEILSVVYGILTLVRGRFALGTNREVRGAPAYVIGVVLLATIPVAVLAAIVLNFDDIVKGNQAALNNVNAKTILPDAIGVVGCWGTALIIAFATARPKVNERRSVTPDYDDYDDDLPRRRGGDYDDETDDRPRRRRPADEYDDEDDRPRRRDDLDDRAR